MKKSLLILGALLWTTLYAMQVAQLPADMSREVSLVLEQEEIIEELRSLRGVSEDFACSKENTKGRSEIASRELTEDMPSNIFSSGVEVLCSLFGFFTSKLGIVRRHPLKALTVVLALQSNIPGANAYNVTNANQNLTYDINGPAVHLLPITILGTFGPWEVSIRLGDVSAGNLTCTDNEGLSPTFSSNFCQATAGSFSFDTPLSNLYFTPAQNRY